MNPEWPTLAVERLQEAGSLLVEDGNHGEYRPRPSEFGSGGTAFVRATDMSEGRVLFESAEHINDVAVRRIRKGIGRGGDILFSHKGTVGKLALVPLDAPPFVCSPQTTFWRTLDESRLDRRFLYYFMLSRAFAEQWQSRKGETDMADYVSLTAQRQFALALPPIEEQRAIARVLGALDDKIELNRQMNRTLEAIAGALFRSLFMDFDAADAVSSALGASGLSREIASSFSGALTHTEIGPIPAGWQVTSIGDVATLVPGKSYTSADLRHSTTALVTLKSFARGGGYRPDGLKAYTGSFRPEQVVHPGELIVARTDVTQAAEVIGRAALVRGDDRFATLVASLDVLIIRPVMEGVTVPFLYCLMRSRDYEDHIAGHANGTTVLHLSREGVPSYKFAWPGASLVRCFTRIAEPSFDRIEQNEKEKGVLKVIRDTLLSKLFSGDIRIVHAERLMEQAI